MSNNFTSTARSLRSVPATLALFAVLLPIGAGFVSAQGPSRAGDALFQQAYDCYNRKDYAQAETLFLRMRAEFPDDDRGVTGLVEVYFTQNRQDDAVRAMRELTAKDPSSFATHVALGNILVRTEQYTPAMGEYQTALKLATARQIGDVYFKMAETYRRMGNMDDAMTYFRRAKDLSSDGAALQLALLLDGTGRRDQAETEYRALLAKEPDQPVALNNLSYILAERGENLDEALNYALRARNAAPESPDIIDTVGWVYMKKRMPDQAAALFSEDLARHDNPLYRQHLAAALDLKGEWTPDSRELRTLLDTAKTPAQVQRMQALLGAAQ